MNLLYGILIGVMVLLSLVLILAILLQSGKGGGVAASFGGVSSSADAFIGQRQAGNLLTKISWWGGGMFLALAFILQLMSSRASAVPESVLDRLAKQPATTAPAPTTKSGTAAPAAPLEPAQPATTAPTTAAPATPTTPGTPAPKQ